MKQDKLGNSENKKFVEQGALGPPSDTFYVSEELAERLRFHANKPCLISG